MFFLLQSPSCLFAPSSANRKSPTAKKWPTGPSWNPIGPNEGLGNASSPISVRLAMKKSSALKPSDSSTPPKAKRPPNSFKHDSLSTEPKTPSNLSGSRSTSRMSDSKIKNSSVAPHLALELVKLLGLDDFLKQHLPPGEEQITDWSAEDLWHAYIQLTEAEAAFRIEKSDLRIRPIWHQKEERVLAHILVCFLAYVLWKTLGQMVKSAGLGDEPFVSI